MTSTQVGAIAENLVVSSMMIESDGRLSPFRPVADDDGVDILVYDKKSGRAVPIQVKSRTLALKKRGTQARGNVVHFGVRAATFKGSGSARLIAVLLSEDASQIERAWLIPMRELPRIASRRASEYVIRASKSEDSKDKFSEYRCLGAADLVSRIVALFDS